MTGPFGPFRATDVAVMAYPGRRCALPWAKLVKPVRLSNPGPAGYRTLALRAIEPCPAGYRTLAHWLGPKFRFAFCNSPRMGQRQLSPGQSEAPPWVKCPSTRPRPEGQNSWRFRSVTPVCSLRSDRAEDRRIRIERPEWTWTCNWHPRLNHNWLSRNECWRR